MGARDTDGTDAGVRRRRWIRTGLGGAVAAAAVGLAVAVPALLLEPTAAGPGPAAPPTTPPATGPDGCPTTPLPVAGDDRPGPLVRPGATQIALCERPGTMPGAAASPARILSRDVDRVVRRLNALETEERLLDRLRRQEEDAGRDGDAVQLGCTAMLYPTALSLALRYPDGVTHVAIDRNCGTVTADGRTRHGGVLDEFLAAYREQLIATTDPATVRSPACPARLGSAQVGPDTGRLRDEIVRTRAEDDPLLPSPLAAVTACRYRPAAGGLALTADRTVRTGLGPVRALLNDATGEQETPGGSTSCALAGVEPSSPTALDVMFVADATGAVVELRVWREPCRALLTTDMGGRTPPVELVTQLDGWLGRSR